MVLYYHQNAPSLLSLLLALDGSSERPNSQGSPGCELGRGGAKAARSSSVIKRMMVELIDHANQPQFEFWTGAKGHPAACEMGRIEMLTNARVLRAAHFAVCLQGAHET